MDRFAGERSIGIVTNNLARHRAGPNKPGQIAYRFDADFDLSTKRLAAHLPAGPAGTEGIRFTPQPDGSGLYCFAGASREPGAIGRLCGSWRPAPAIPAGLRGRIARSCAR